MPSPIYRYPLDKTGIDPNNFVQNEPHSLNPHSDLSDVRVLCPLYGPFYVNGNFAIRDRSNGRLLDRDIDYKINALLQDPTLLFGQEICQFVVITNGLVSDEVSVSYQVLGGNYQNDATAVQQVFETFLNDTRPVDWNSVSNKPATLPPSAHIHMLEDVIGWGPVIAQLERVREAILLSNTPMYEALIDWVNSRIASQSGGVPLSREINTPASGGLSGGGTLADDLTLTIADTGVVAGEYGSPGRMIVAEVNSRGQLLQINDVAAEFPWDVIYDTPTTIEGYRIAGGTFTEAVGFASETWNAIGDNVFFGDVGEPGIVGIRNDNESVTGFNLYSGENLLGQFASSLDGRLYWNGANGFSLTGDLFLLDGVQQKNIHLGSGGFRAMGNSTHAGFQDDNGNYFLLSDNGVTWSGIANGNGENITRIRWSNIIETPTTLAGYGITDGGGGPGVDSNDFVTLSNKLSPNITGTQLNSIDKTGFYWGANLNFGNQGLDNGAWFISHQEANADWAVQIATSFGYLNSSVNITPGTVYMRNRLPGGWTDWKRQINADGGSMGDIQTTLLFSENGIETNGDISMGTNSSDQRNIYMSTSGFRMFGNDQVIGFQNSYDKYLTLGETGIAWSDVAYGDGAGITNLQWSAIQNTPTTLAGYGITDGGSIINPDEYVKLANKASLLISNTDLNDIDKTGFYQGTNLINGPNNSFWYITHQRHNNDWAVQTAVAFGTNGNIPGRSYQRAKVSGVWSDWKLQMDADGGAFTGQVTFGGGTTINSDGAIATSRNIVLQDGTNQMNVRMGDGGYGVMGNSVATGFQDADGHYLLLNDTGITWSGAAVGNGSGLSNVPWSSLTGIPGTLAGHGLDPDDFVLLNNGQSIDLSDNDLNLVAKSGFFKGQNLTNAPDNGFWYITHQQHDSSWASQTAIAYGGTISGGRTFHRVKANNTWSAWKQFIDSDGGYIGGSLYFHDVTDGRIVFDQGQLHALSVGGDGTAASNETTANIYARQYRDLLLNPGTGGIVYVGNRAGSRVFIGNIDNPGNGYYDHGYNLEINGGSFTNGDGRFNGNIYFEGTNLDDGFSERIIDLPGSMYLFGNNRNGATMGFWDPVTNENFVYTKGSGISWSNQATGNGSGITNIQWNNIDGKPAAYPTTWNDVAGKPTFSDVAVGIGISMVATSFGGHTSGQIVLSSANLANAPYPGWPSTIVLQWATGTPTGVEGEQTIWWPVTMSTVLTAWVNTNNNGETIHDKTWADTVFQLVSASETTCVVLAQRTGDGATPCTPTVFAIGYV